MNQCLGCKGCQMACKDKNGLEPGIYFRRVETVPVTSEGKQQWVNYSGSCNHCVKPACTAVCPTGAMKKAEDGTVVHDRGKCIGCGSCVANCPYGVPFLHPRLGYVQKCDACFDLRALGKQPACVAACPTRALKFGDLEELRSTCEAKTVRQISILPDSRLTDPSLLISPKSGLGMTQGDTAAGSAEEMAEGTVRILLKDTDETFAVLGCGIAGVRAAAAIRERNRTARIIMIGDERILPYSRTMLSKAAFHGFDIRKYLIEPVEWYEENRIDLRLGARVTAIHTDEKSIELEDHMLIHYDKCIYALGGNCFVPPITGVDKKNIYVVRRQTDMEQMRRTLLAARDAVIIGGGVIGLEIAWELKKSGIRVTVLELAGTLMERLLDADTAAGLEQAVSLAGIRVITGAQIEEITGSLWADGVKLKDGTCYQADLVILSAGIRANGSIAAMAGIKVNRAIVVNSRMETSVSGIYACGDCAEYEGVNTGTWTQSNRQGYVVGANAAGEHVEYKQNPAPVIVHVAGTSLFSIGDMGKDSRQAYTCYRRSVTRKENLFQVNGDLTVRETMETYFAIDGLLVGAALLGNLEKMELVQKAVKEHWSISELGLKETEMVRSE